MPLTAVRPSIPISSAPEASAKVTAPYEARPCCSTCRLRHHCLPATLGPAETSALDGLMIGRRRVRAGQTLFAEGGRFQFLYAVFAGSFKSTIALKDGREQVTAFPIAGDFIGFDGLANGSYASSAIALEDAIVCAIPYMSLVQLSSELPPALRLRLNQLGAIELVREKRLTLVTANLSSDARLAAFLLQLAHRMRERGYSDREFLLRMSRADIGSYLGLTLETVSRMLSQFARNGWIEVRKRHLKLLDPEQLALLCDESVIPEWPLTRDGPLEPRSEPFVRALQLAG